MPFLFDFLGLYFFYFYVNENDLVPQEKFRILYEGYFRNEFFKRPRGYENLRKNGGSGQDFDRNRNYLFFLLRSSKAGITSGEEGSVGLQIGSILGALLIFMF